MLRPHKKLKPKPSPELSSPPWIDGVVSSHHHDQSPSRRWEELEAECLANVFAKVGMESLVLALPFVCKSWYAAFQNPLCWKFLHFPEFEPYPLFTAVPVDDDTVVEPKSFGPFYNKFVEDNQIDSSRFSITGFIKLVVSRSKGKALELKLPQFCTEEALRYVADACPGIRDLHFSDDLVLFKHSQILPEVIGKWKFLERLTLGGNMENIMRQFQVKSGDHLSRDFEMLLPLDSVSPISNKNLYEILVQVGIHCKRMRALHIFDGCVGQAEAEAIVTGLPNLVFLTLGSSRIERNTLVTLLQGCDKLCCFNVWNCEGFVMAGEEMRELGSHIREFRWTRDLTGYKCSHVLKMVILSRARLNQILRKRNK